MTWRHPAFEDLARRVGARTGLTFEPVRRAALEDGVRRAMARAGVADPSRFGEVLEADSEILDDLISELTVGETYFFREPAQFEFLRGTALPGLRRDRGEGAFLRAWSAGCASGEEAYSLAILFTEEGLAGRSSVLATDLSRSALAKAALARYGPWSLRGEGAATARPYLRPVGERFEVVEAIRRSVVVRPLNLASDAYPSAETGTWGLDLILCRNVLIYFDKETVRAVARRLFASLAEGGWLLTASSDPPLSGEAPFESVVTDAGIFYRRGPGAGPVAGPAPRIPTALILPPMGREKGPGPPPESGPPSDSGPPSEVIPRPIDDGDPPGPAVADRDPEVAGLREEFARGHYDRVAERAMSLAGDAEADALRVRALANLDTAEADRACEVAAARHPFSCELHHLRAVLLMALGRDEEAARAARRVIYLDRALAVAHFTLGSALRRLGDRAGAWRAFRNARDLCAARPAEEVVPLSDGEPAGRLAEAAGAQLSRLGTPPGGPR